MERIEGFAVNGNCFYCYYQLRIVLVGGVNAPCSYVDTAIYSLTLSLSLIVGGKELLGEAALLKE